MLFDTVLKIVRGSVKLEVDRTNQLQEVIELLSDVLQELKAVRTAQALLVEEILAGYRADDFNPDKNNFS